VRHPAVAALCWLGNCAWGIGFASGASANPVAVHRVEA
jgi:hypothetical protein